MRSSWRERLGLDGAERPFGITSAQVALTLTLNGWSPDEAIEKAKEFSEIYGNEYLTESVVQEMCNWALEVR
jgi:hypothetical protein